ncbi:MAG: hydroxyethylthiazole kinase [Bacilli bacterium]
MSIRQVRECRPLVLHVTNTVTINDCANMTLAVGASPLMSFNEQEYADLMRFTDAVVVNIGTMEHSSIPLFLQVVKMANASGKPVVLDPVGCGASELRSGVVRQLLSHGVFSVIKGNASEIAAIAGITNSTRGVDSTILADDVRDTARALALDLGCVVVVTGETDWVTDGTRLVGLPFGVPMLAQVCGTGCMTASLVASFVGTGLDAFDASVRAVMLMGWAGEQAFSPGIGLGSFKVGLFDAIGCADDTQFVGLEERVYDAPC